MCFKWDLLGEVFKVYKWLMNIFDVDKKICMLIYKCIIKRVCILKSSLFVFLYVLLGFFFLIYESIIIVMYDLIKIVNIF